MWPLLQGLRYPLRIWLLNLLCWIGGGGLVAVVIWSAYQEDFLERFVRLGLLLGTFGLLAPPVFRWGQDFERSSRLATWIFALLIFAAFLAVHGALYTACRQVVAGWSDRFGGGVVNRSWWSYFGSYLNRAWLLDSTMFVGIVAVAQSVASRRRLRETEREAVELKRQLAEAQLAALRAQLQPHFLFNTLHTVGLFTRRDPDAANRILALVGDLLRRSLDSVTAQEITLREEVEFLKPYLEIQRTRFQDRLTVELEIDDACADLQVPSFVLQPLVENAVRHGIEAKAGQGRIAVRAGLQGGVLVLEVEDNGIGLQGSVPGQREGVGLRNTRERLARLYGAVGSLTLSPSESGGVLARVTVPRHSDPVGVVA